MHRQLVPDALSAKFRGYNDIPEPADTTVEYTVGITDDLIPGFGDDRVEIRLAEVQCDECGKVQAPIFRRKVAQLACFREH